MRGGEVSARDVERVIDAARAVAIPLDRQVLHILPQQFAVDDQEGVREPVGMAGVRLEARIHIVTAAQSYGQNLTKCCERAGVTPSEMVFEPLASADAALFPGGARARRRADRYRRRHHRHHRVSRRRRDAYRGAADRRQSSDQRYRGRTAHAASPTPSGSRSAYGVATNLVVRRDEMVQVPGVGGREPRVIARRLLGEIIEPRMEEIFAMAQRELMRSGVSDSLASGVVLVGGTSLLEGTQELAERIFGLPVRRGLPINLKGTARRIDEADVHDRGRACCCIRARPRGISNGLGRVRAARAAALALERLGERFLLRRRANDET